MSICLYDKLNQKSKEISIRALGFGKKEIQFEGAGIRNLGQLANWLPKAYSRSIPGIGQATIEEIKQVMGVIESALTPSGNVELERYEALSLKAGRQLIFDDHSCSPGNELIEWTGTRTIEKSVLDTPIARFLPNSLVSKLKKLGGNTIRDIANGVWDPSQSLLKGVRRREKLKLARYVASLESSVEAGGAVSWPKFKTNLHHLRVPESEIMTLNNLYPYHGKKGEQCLLSNTSEEIRLMGIDEILPGRNVSGYLTNNLNTIGEVAHWLANDQREHLDGVGKVAVNKAKVFLVALEASITSEGEVDLPHYTGLLKKLGIDHDEISIVKATFKIRQKILSPQKSPAPLIETSDTKPDDTTGDLGDGCSEAKEAIDKPVAFASSGQLKDLITNLHKELGRTISTGKISEQLDLVEKLKVAISFSAHFPTTDAIKTPTQVTVKENMNCGSNEAVTSARSENDKDHTSSTPISRETQRDLLDETHSDEIIPQKESPVSHRSMVDKTRSSFNIEDFLA